MTCLFVDAIVVDVRIQPSELAGTPVADVALAMRTIITTVTSLLLSTTSVACGGEPSTSEDPQNDPAASAAGDPNDPHYKPANEPFVFIYIDEDGGGVRFDVRLGRGKGDGSFTPIPNGWSFVAHVGDASRPLGVGEGTLAATATFGAQDSATNTTVSATATATTPIYVDVSRPNWPGGRTVRFDALVAPTFDAPKINGGSDPIKLGSIVDIELQPILFPPDAQDCRQSPDCTSIHISTDAPCVGYESDVILLWDSPGSYAKPRNIPFLPLPSRFSSDSAQQCSGNLSVAAMRSKTYADGVIVFKRVRGRQVVFTR